MDLQSPTLLLGWFAVFVFSVTVHEAAHAWIAKLGGDHTAYSGGQVSLNPVPHMRREPIGMLLLPIISLIAMGWPIGYASAPFDPRWADRYPKRAALMALAGPFSNLFIALLCLLLMWIGLQTSDFVLAMKPLVQIVSGQQGTFAYGLSYLLSMLLVMNFLLFIFNIMPIPPLDGSGVLPMFMSATQTQRFREIAYTPAFMLIGFVIVWKLIGIIFWPSLRFLLRFLY